jgi:hypothetical protein
VLCVVCSYYSALDAPKTGVLVDILEQYKLEFSSLKSKPEWHSRSVKQLLRAGGSPGSKLRGTQQPAVQSRVDVRNVIQ